MKKIILFALCLSLFSSYLLAQKEKIKEDKREIIIIKNGDKEKKLTIETKDGQTFINGKPSSEFKDEDISVIKQRFMKDNFLFTPGADGFEFNNDGGEMKPFLGVTTQKDNDGVKITNITKQSGADKAGLQEGDVITKVGNKKISNPDELLDAVATYKPKDEIKIAYLRNGKSNEAIAVLGNRSTITRTFSYNGNALNGQMFNDFNVRVPQWKNLSSQSFNMFSNNGHGRLGVGIEDTENEVGAKVTNVEKESAAEKAGLQKDDIITEVNGKKVKDINEIRKELAELKDKNTYNIKAKRNGSDMNFEIKIPKRLNKANL